MNTSTSDDILSDNTRLDNKLKQDQSFSNRRK